MKRPNRPRTAGRDVFKLSGLLADFTSYHVEFTVEDFTTFARAKGICRPTIGRHVGNMLKGFQWAGILKKSDRYEESDRNGSPLRVWVSTTIPAGKVIAAR